MLCFFVEGKLIHSPMGIRRWEAEKVETGSSFKIVP